MKFNIYTNIVITKDSFQNHRNQLADVTSWWPFTEPRTATAN